MRFDINSPSDGYAYAIDVLSRQDRSEKDLYDRLVRKGFSDIVAEAVIIKLKDLHYIDDVRLAENYLRSHLEIQSVGMLRQKLIQRGVGKADIDTAFSNIMDDDMTESVVKSQSQAVYALLRKKHFLEEGVDSRKVMASIYRRGYSPDAVWEALVMFESSEFTDEI